MTRLLLAALLLTPPAASAQNGPATSTLRETYRAALENSDAIAISEKTLSQAQSLYRAALGSSFPELSARNDTSWQDRRASGDSTQSDGALRLSQTGLTGYRELALVKASKSTAAQREQERRRAEQLLLDDVAAAFYGLIQARENSGVTFGLIELADKRLAEVKERVRVGRAREADALAQRVQSESLRSQLEESQRQAGARSDLLEYLTRAPVVPEPVYAEAPPPGPLSGYLARLETRPDVAAAREAVKASGGAIDVARADFLPEVSYQANWYGYRPAARSNNKWDAAASVSLPLFSFGATRAAVASARAAYGRQELVLRAAVRSAELDVRNAHRDYSSAVRQVVLQRGAAALAQRDYDLQVQDERRGLVTAIEVLQSLDRLNVANLALNNALVQARLAAIKLETAAGAMPEEILSK